MADNRENLGVVRGSDQESKTLTKWPGVVPRSPQSTRWIGLITQRSRVQIPPPQPNFEVPGDKTGTIGRRNKVDQLPDARRSGRPLLVQLTSSPLLSSSSVTF